MGRPYAYPVHQAQNCPAQSPSQSLAEATGIEGVQEAGDEHWTHGGPRGPRSGCIRPAVCPWKEVRFSKADLFGLHQFIVPWMEDREFLMRLRTHENKSKLPLTSNCNHLIRSPTSITSLQLNHQLQTPN